MVTRGDEGGGTHLTFGETKLVCLLSRLNRATAITLKVRFGVCVFVRAHAHVCISQKKNVAGAFECGHGCVDVKQGWIHGIRCA